MRTRARRSACARTGLVDAGTARGGLAENARGGGVVLAEDVERQGAGALVDKVDGVVDGSERDDRQDRPKDLGLHEVAVELHVGDQRRPKVAARAVAVAAKDDRARARVGEQALDLVKVFVVDEPAVVLALLDVVAVKGTQALDRRLDKVLDQRLVDQGVVGRDARLAAVLQLAPGTEYDRAA